MYEASEDSVKEAVDVHNSLRQRHGVPPWKVTKDVCNKSRKWVNYLIDNNDSSHRLNGLGENLTEKTGNSENFNYTSWSIIVINFKIVNNQNEIHGTHAGPLTMQEETS